MHGSRQGPVVWAFAVALNVIVPLTQATSVDGPAVATRLLQQAALGNAGQSDSPAERVAVRCDLVAVTPDPVQNLRVGAGEAGRIGVPVAEPCPEGVRGERQVVAVGEVKSPRQRHAISNRIGGERPSVRHHPGPQPLAAAGPRAANLSVAILDAPQVIAIRN